MTNSVLDLLKVKFPVIAFGRDNSIFFANEKDDIIICTKTALKNGFYQGLDLIDSDGRLYQVEEAKQIGTVGLLWGYNIFLNQKLKVDLLVKDSEGIPIVLNDFKEKIVKNLNRDKMFWNSDGLLHQRINFIREAASHKVIIKQLTDDFYKKHK